MYKNKYLKYKFKYIQLLKQFGGECDSEPNEKDVDPIDKRSLKYYKKEHIISIGTPRICMSIKSAFLHFILHQNKKIEGMSEDISNLDKFFLKDKFKKNFYKLCLYNTGKEKIFAIMENDFIIIPFDGFYQQIEIKNIKKIEEIDIWTEAQRTAYSYFTTGSLVIIRKLLSFTTINNSLGVIIKKLKVNQLKGLIF
jgi:hypothetical protein